MTRYCPDRWVLLKLTNSEGEDTYKVLAGWYGGFADSDSWKLSSGTVEFIAEESAYVLPQYSGSTYVCYKNSYGLSVLMLSILTSFKDMLEEAPDAGALEVLPFNFDISTLQTK